MKNKIHGSENEQSVSPLLLDGSSGHSSCSELSVDSFEVLCLNVFTEPSTPPRPTNS